MGRKELTELTNLCLIHRGDLLLLQNRKKSDWQGYALPGGHIEPGETALEAAARELEEETGYCARNYISLGKMLPTPGNHWTKGR